MLTSLVEVKTGFQIRTVDSEMTGLIMYLYHLFIIDLGAFCAFISDRREMTGNKADLESLIAF